MINTTLLSLLSNRVPLLTEISDAPGTIPTLGEVRTTVPDPSMTLDPIEGKRTDATILHVPPSQAPRIAEMPAVLPSVPKNATGSDPPCQEERDELYAGPITRSRAEVQKTMYQRETPKVPQSHIKQEVP